MSKHSHATLPVLALLVTSALSTPAFAYPVEVVHSVPIDTQVVPALGTIGGTLGSILTTLNNIGGATTQGTDKLSAMIEESARNRELQENFNRQANRLEQARKTYTVPESLCSESASGVASLVAAGSIAREGRLAGGSGIGNAAIRNAVTAPALPQEQDQFQAATIHSQYCTAQDMAAWGGSALCKGASLMPGGDTEVRSVFYGAGAPEKAPDLTFSQAQTDAAMMYMKNSSQLSIGKQLSKGEARTASGQQYAGIMDQYQAVQSAAKQPQLAMIAASQPNPLTRAPLAEALQTPSAAAYFNETASSEARRTGILSTREFESFEVGRRYANTDYLTDLQAMSGDNLLRESIRVQNLGNWLLLGIKQQLAQSAVTSGQQLSLQAVNTFTPRLQERQVQTAAGVTTHE